MVVVDGSVWFGLFVCLSGVSVSFSFVAACSLR